MYELSFLAWLEEHQLPCLLKGVFGIECPGCGFQTAVLLLLKGELWESVKTYPGLIPLAVFVGLAIAHFMGVKKNCPRCNKICRFCLLANNFNFIFAQINNSLKL